MSVLPHQRTHIKLSVLLRELAMHGLLVFMKLVVTGHIGTPFHQILHLVIHVAQLEQLDVDQIAAAVQKHAQIPARLLVHATLQRDIPLVGRHAVHQYNIVKVVLLALPNVHPRGVTIITHAQQTVAGQAITACILQ